MDHPTWIWKKLIRHAFHWNLLLCLHWQRMELPWEFQPTVYVRSVQHCQLVCMWPLSYQVYFIERFHIAPTKFGVKESGVHKQMRWVAIQYGICDPQWSPLVWQLLVFKKFFRRIIPLWCQRQTRKCCVCFSNVPYVLVVLDVICMVLQFPFAPGCLRNLGLTICAVCVSSKVYLWNVIKLEVFVWSFISFRKPIPFPFIVNTGVDSPCIRTSITINNFAPFLRRTWLLNFLLDIYLLDI